MSDRFQFGQLVCLKVTYQRSLKIQMTQEVIILQLPQLHKALPEIPQSKMLQILYILKMLKNILIQSSQILKEDVLDILASLADHPEILVFEVAK